PPPRETAQRESGTPGVPDWAAPKTDVDVRYALLASNAGESVVNNGKSKQPSDERVTRRAGWRLMRDAVRPHRKMMYLGGAVGLVWAVARVSVPTFAKIAIDNGIVPGKWGTTATWTVCILAVGAVQGISTGLRRYAAFGLAWRVETDLRMKLVAHL